MSLIFKTNIIIGDVYISSQASCENKPVSYQTKRNEAFRAFLLIFKTSHFLEKLSDGWSQAKGILTVFIIHH